MTLRKYQVRIDASEANRDYTKPEYIRVWATDSIDAIKEAMVRTNAYNEHTKALLKEFETLKGSKMGEVFYLDGFGTFEVVPD